MKKILFIFLATVLLFSVNFAQKTTIIKLNAKKDNFKVTTLNRSGFTIESSLSAINLNPVSTEKGNFVIPEVENMIKIFDEGIPNIPVISKLIEVPQGAKVEFIIKSYDEEIIKLHDYGINDKIMPALRSQSKSEDDVPFIKNEQVYNTDDFTNKKIVEYGDAGQIRAYRLGRIEIRPIQYNPVRNTLRILNNLVVEVKFKDADFASTDALKRKYSSPLYNNMLGGQILNFDKNANKELITQTPTHMVIVSDRMFEEQLEPFITWKEKKGFEITVAYTDDIGSTTSTIKTYLQGIYESDNPMSFVLFVGDVQQIPAWSGNSGSHVTDLRYCEYTGDDLPEVVYGRFSAQNTSQLQPQIDKTLMYEKYEMSDPSYLSEVFLVAGDDSGNEMTFGNGAIWYADNYYMTEENGVNAHTYLQPLNNSDVSDIIFEDMNAGLAFANYTAHCSSGGWATPSFSTSDVNNLSNNEKYGLWIGNCCLSVKFDDSECFGEAALRKANGGAIGDIGGSNSTYWDEDYWWGIGLKTGSETGEPQYEETGLGVFDGVMHTKVNEVNDISTWYVTQGQMVLSGNLAVEASSSSRKEYYWEIYHLMGDPSLMNYIGVPEVITYSFSPDILMIGATSVDISTVPYGYIAIHQNDERIAVAMADENGDASLNFSNTITGGDVTMVITAQNKQPLIENLTPIAASEPYILVDSYTPENVDYNSISTIDIVLKNAADPGYDAANVTAVLSTTDSYFTIIDDTENIGTINGGQTINISDAFSIDVADNVPDQYEAEFVITMTGNDAKYEWTSDIDIIANAPVLEILFNDINDNSNEVIFTSTPITDIAENTVYSYEIIVENNMGDGDGVLDAGETAGINILTGNFGHANIIEALCTLSSTSNYVTVNTNEVYIGTLEVDQELPANFSITIDEECPTGENIELIFNIIGGEYSEELILNLTVGIQTEDFESGDFLSYDWTMGGNGDWIISNDPHEGVNSAQSGNIGDSQTSELSINCNVSSDGTISFWSKVSSEEDYDYLRFYIDGTKKDQWAGTVGWAEHSYNIGAGVHTFKWTYEKDINTDNGSDCGWVDDITFPGFSAGKNSKNITITAQTIPDWLTLTDNGNGTGQLSGTSPSEQGLHNVILSAQTSGEPTSQDFNISVGGLSVEALKNSVSVYPIPNNGIFYVDIKNLSESAEIQIIDIKGKAIFNTIATNRNFKIDLSYLSKGFYFIKIISGNEIYNSKIILE